MADPVMTRRPSRYWSKHAHGDWRLQNTGNDQIVAYAVRVSRPNGHEWRYSIPMMEGGQGYARTLDLAMYAVGCKLDGAE